MAHLGESMKKVFRKTGREYVILFPDKTESAPEFAKFASNTQATKPFTVKTTQKAALPFDTGIQPGDLLRVTDNDAIYSVTVMNAEVFAKKTKQHATTLYACNAAVTLLRKEEVKNPVTRDRSMGWGTSHRGVEDTPATLSDAYFGESLVEDSRRSQFGDGVSDAEELYVSAFWVRAEMGDHFRVKPLDPAQQWEPFICEIVGVKRNRFDNVHAFDIRRLKKTADG